MKRKKNEICGLIEIDGEFFLPNVATINSYQNSSNVILVNFKKDRKIIPLGKRSELDSDLMKRIEEKLNKQFIVIIIINN